jgi:hypothetical protein
MSRNDEFEPYLLYRIDRTQFECALWTMPEGTTAVALFQTGDRALAYRGMLGLGDDWKVFRPGKPDLMQILKTAYQSGIAQAVLDPDMQSAQYVFDLRHVLQELGELP